MIANIKIRNNKQPQLPVIFVFIYVQFVYKHQASYQMIWNNLIRYAVQSVTYRAV